ncbi:MAG: hypothetical protein WAM14_04340 [Candidatus Nitrosopolaris sp.]
MFLQRILWTNITLCHPLLELQRLVVVVLVLVVIVVIDTQTSSGSSSSISGSSMW